MRWQAAGFWRHEQNVIRRDYLSENRLKDFAQSINGAVYRSVAAAFLLSAWLGAASLPLVDLVYRRGRFQWEDAKVTAVYFAIFAASLALWTAQALYARSFYAARNTLTPMVAATLITAASVPMFGWLFRAWGIIGLAIGSDIGILAHTVVLAVLLHRRKLVPLGEMRWLEIAKALLVAAAAALAALSAMKLVPLTGSRSDDVKAKKPATIWAMWLWDFGPPVPSCRMLCEGGQPMHLRRLSSASCRSHDLCRVGFGPGALASSANA